MNILGVIRAGASGLIVFGLIAGKMESIVTGILVLVVAFAFGREKDADSE